MIPSNEVLGFLIIAAAAWFLLPNKVRVPEKLEPTVEKMTANMDIPENEPRKEGTTKMWLGIIATLIAVFLLNLSSNKIEPVQTQQNYQMGITR